MKKAINRYFISGLLLMMTGILSVSYVMAQTNLTDFVFDPVSANPPRSCVLENGVTIVAGENNDPAAVFPKIVNDPPIPNSTSTLHGSYLKWDYTFTYPVRPRGSSRDDDYEESEGRPSRYSNLYLSVSGDTSIFNTLPSILDIQPSCGSAHDQGHKSESSSCESRILRFPAVNPIVNSGYQYSVSFITPLGYTPRIASAGVQSGRQKTPDYCLIAGASKQDTVYVATVESQIVSTPGCRVELVKDSSGRVASATLTDPNNPNCQIETSPASYICDSDGGVNPQPVDCKKVVSNLPENGLASEGSCNYSYTNTMGGKTTIACTTCCIQKSTNKCVLKSSLSSTSLCTAGSL